MDELVIEEKKYLSSKKAAKLTGYAKDYVGQLCREGKVEARLVGRNWYVLEGSIMDHRFGAVSDVKDEDSSSATVPTLNTSNEVENSLEYKWNPPVYTAESYSSLPTEVPQASPELLPQEKTANPQALNDMQSAWQEWFDKQKEAEKMLPDASEMLLPEADEIETTVKTEDYAELKVKDIYPSQFEDHQHEHVDYSSEEVSIPIHHVSTKPEEDVVREEEEEVVPISRKREENVYKSSYQSHVYSKKPSVAPKMTRRESRREGKGYLLKVIILSIAGIFMAITYLAFSSRDAAEGGKGNSLINYITGVSTVSSHK